MDELIKEVIKRTGLNEDQARAAAEAVINHLKERLPDPAAGALSKFLNGQKKAQIAAVAATTAAVNVVVLPHAH